MHSKLFPYVKKDSFCFHSLKSSEIIFKVVNKTLWV